MCPPASRCGSSVWFPWPLLCSHTVHTVPWRPSSLCSISTVNFLQLSTGNALLPLFFCCFLPSSKAVRLFLAQPSWNPLTSSFCVCFCLEECGGSGKYLSLTKTRVRGLGLGVTWGSLVNISFVGCYVRNNNLVTFRIAIHPVSRIFTRVPGIMPGPWKESSKSFLINRKIKWPWPNEKEPCKQGWLWGLLLDSCEYRSKENYHKETHNRSSLSHVKSHVCHCSSLHSALYFALWLEAHCATIICAVPSICRLCCTVALGSVIVSLQDVNREVLKKMF